MTLNYKDCYTKEFTKVILAIETTLLTLLNAKRVPVKDYITTSDTAGARIEFDNCTIIIDKNVEVKGFYRASFISKVSNAYFCFGGNTADATISTFKSKLLEII